MSRPAGLETVLHRGTRTPDLRVHLAVPDTLGPGTRVVVVLHGVLRDAERYRDSWSAWGGRHDHLVVCPEVDEAGWPGAEGYNLGNVLGPAGELRPREEWLFTAVQDVVAALGERFGLDDRRFDLWGHSAGAQVVHRFVLFCPGAPLRHAIAANAGWYTVPDPAVAFPYGTGGLRLDEGGTRVPLVVMRGDRDTVRDEHLRTGPEADAQGRTRFARAGHFHAAGHAADPGCRWELVDVPGAGHEHTQMAPAAQAYLQARLSDR